MNFKRTLHILLLLSFFQVFSFAETSRSDEINQEYYRNLLNVENSEYLSLPQMGEYAIYKSSYADAELIMTIIHTGPRRYLIQTFNKNNYKISKFHVVVKRNKGMYEIEGVSIEQGDLSGTDIKLAQTDFMMILNDRSQLDVTQFPDDLTQVNRIVMIDTTFSSTYKYWIPITNLYSRTDEGNRANRIELLRFGQMSNEQESEILNFRGINVDFDNSPSFKVAQKRSEPQIMDGIKIPLDRNWTRQENANNAVFESNGDEFAFVSIKTFKKENLPEKAEQFFGAYLNQNSAFVLPDSVSISSFKGAPLLGYTVLDIDQMKKNIFYIMMFDRGEFTSIMTFGASRNFYVENREYFDRILF